MEYDFNMIDYGLVPVVIAIVQWLKKYVRERWIPIIPLPVSLVITGLAIVGLGEWASWPAFLARAFVEGLKVAFASMGFYKLWKTTLKGE